MADTQETTTVTTPAPQEAPAEKTFTQTEVDTIVARRLAKAQKGLPTDEELTAFRAWKDSQQTEQQRLASITQERDTARVGLAAALAQVEQYQHEKVMMQKGVPADDIDYYVFKAEQLVSDTKTFEQAADEVINARRPQNKVVVNLGGSLQGNNAPKTASDMMNALIRGAGK